MKDNARKYCIFCEKKFGMKNNYCPVCGRELQVQADFNLINSFEPYLKGTNFELKPSRNGQQYNFIYNLDNRINIYKDTKKILKRLVKNKPNFLMPTVRVYTDYEKLKFAINLIDKDEPPVPFISYLYLPVNKESTKLILCLIGKENVEELINRCQDEVKWRDDEIKRQIAINTTYKKLYQQLKEGI